MVWKSEHIEMCMLEPCNLKALCGMIPIGQKYSITHTQDGKVVKRM